MDKSTYYAAKSLLETRIRELQKNGIYTQDGKIYVHRR